MVKEFVVISTKVPKELAKKFVIFAEEKGKKPSRLLREIIQSKAYEDTEEILTCYKCDKEIKENEPHFTNSLSIMKYYRKDNGDIDFDNPTSIDAHIKELLCKKCAMKRKDLKKFKLKWK